MGGVEIGGFERRQLVICGSKSTIELRPLEANISEEVIGEKYMLTTKQRECVLEQNGHCKINESESEPIQRYEKMMLSFAEMVRGEKENPYTLDYELALFKTIMQCCDIKDNKM